VVQLACDARLVNEHRDELAVRRELWMEALDNDRLLKAGSTLGARKKDLGHAAESEATHQTVLAKC